MKPLRVICIDASDRPEEIPEDLWVKQDEIYTIKEVGKLAVQDFKIGYKFEEVELEPFTHANHPVQIRLREPKND